MESGGCKDGPGNNVVVNSKLRSPGKVNDSHTMDSFQDGGQQNMNSEQNDFPPPLDGPHMNSEINNYPTGPGDQGIPPDGYGRLNEGMNPGQMQGYGYNRGNYNMGDQHGGLNMGGSPDFSQGSQYHSQYHQGGMRPGFPTGPKHSMGHIRPGMGPPGMGMMPPGYNSGNQRMMSGQSIAQQGGPTPTLNQLLQTPNTTQRFPNSYNEFGGGPQKPAGDMSGGDSPYGGQQGWGSQRPMNPYSQGPMSGNVPFRNQSGGMPPDMNSQRRVPGMPPSYPSQSGQYGSSQQFSPNSQPQRYGMMPGQQSGRGLPGPMGQMNQPYNQQGFSNNRQTPSKQSNQENDTEVNSTFEEGSDGGRLSTPPNSSSGPQHPTVSSLRPVSSPAGSSSSRSNTPASLTGNQAGSPMPPRPSSRQLDGQNRMNNQSPMPTTYNQQMMPPPMGPNQMGYPSGNKMGPNGPQMGPNGPQMGHFPQYNSQFHQGNYPRQAGPGPGPGPGSGMQGYGGPHQNSFNGPNQMPANSMYGNMNRNMPNMPGSGFPSSFNQGNNMQMGMANQYGNFNTSNNHPNSTGTSSGMNVNSSMGPPGNSGMPNLGSPSGQSAGASSAAAKGAQAAAQAAMLAAANSAVNRPQPGIRPSTAPMTNHPRIYPSQGMGPMGQMNSMGSGPGSYPNMNQMSNSQSPMNQMPNSMSQSPVPSSMNQMPNSNMSEAGGGGMGNSTGMGVMGSSGNMPNSNMPPHMNMPNASMPHSGMPSHMPNVGMPHSGFPTNSNNPLSNMASMSEGILSSNPPGSGIPNTNMPNSSSLQSSSGSGVSSDSGISSSSSKMGSSSSSGSGPTPPLPNEGKPSSATPPSSAGPVGENSSSRSPPSSKAGPTPPLSQAASFPIPPTTVPSTSAAVNCAPSPGEDVKPPTTTTNTNSVTTSTVVTQSITSPVTSTAENSNSSSVDAQSEGMINIPVVCTPSIVEDTPDKKKKKSGTPDLSKLFDMGEEPNRRPFLERLFQYLEEKGTPVTVMPSISKQPLDLFKLYMHVKEKGGMMEVTKTKKWKEICGVVNIGASASAAFTLKKNYIKYLFSYECKFDRGGIDPAPILAQMELALAQKRESKNRGRAPSPAGSQGSQDAFRPPSTPNSQSMDQFHPGMPQPGGFMGNDVGMGPMGNNMMPHNNMMNNMPPPGAMGNMPPHSMPHQSMGHAGGNMQPGGMMHGNMPPNNMMPHNNYNMGQGNMMGPGTNGMPPPSQANNNMMPSNSDSVSVQDPFADEPNSGAQYPRFGPANQMPYNAGMQPPTSMNNSFNQYGNRPGMGGSNVPVPPYNNNNNNGTTHPNNANFNDNVNRAPPSQGEQFNESYRGPPRSTEGFTGNQAAPGPDSFPANTPGQFPGNRMNPANQQPGQFPYGGQQQFERFDQQSGMPPSGNQQFRPSHPQPGMTGVPPSSQQMGPDQMYPGRFGSQQASPRPPMSQPSQFNQQQSFPNQGSGFPTPSKTMSGTDQYQRYPTPPPPHPQQKPSTPQSQSSPFPNQRPIYGTPPKRYPDMELRDYNVPPDNRRDWSPMPRYPLQHPGSPYSGPPMGNMPPGHHPNMGMPYNRFNRSPNRDKIMGYMSPQKMQKSGMMPGGHYMTKKEIIFPPDSVEATQPYLAKRKKLNSKDVGQVEAWRLMMALKSGMLAESTWALDTLSVMLYDDNTVGYFGLIHLPGMLEVLIEHFRQCLVQIFGCFTELEIKQSPKKSPCKKLRVASDSEGEELSDLDPCPEDLETNCRLSLPDYDEVKDSFKWENYTYTTRQGKSVKIEENSKDADIMSDPKLWDTFVGFHSSKQHWKIGHGEITKHIATHFESDENLSVLKKLFFSWINKHKTTSGDSEIETSDTDIEKPGESEKVNDIVANGSVDTTVIETEKSTNSVESKESTTDSEKNNCACDNDNLKNDFVAVSIKKEPVDPEEVPMDVQDPLTNSVENHNSDPVESKSPSSEEKSENKIISEEVSENTDVPPNGPAKSPVQSSDLSNDKPYLACFFNTEKNTKDLLRGYKRALSPDLEEEAYQRDEPALCLTSCSREEISKRCICVSNILRSLSFIPGNDLEMSKHAGLLYLYGKLLLLQHTHNPRAKNRPKLDHDDGGVTEDVVDLTHGVEGWWWDCLNALRENTLVTLANISGKLNLSKFPEEICLPLMDGLLHWSVCPSACAQDPLPTMPSTSVLSPKRLVLETLCKLSIQDANVDLMLATPPFNRIVQLFSSLCKLLANKKQQVTQEFAIVLLSALVQGDSSAARAIAMQHPCISLLIDFLETAEQNALQVANTHGVQMLRDNPETMGTSLDMLRRAASTLVHMARVPENRTLFVHHQSRLLALVMSQILDQHVAQILAEVLYECSQSS